MMLNSRMDQLVTSPCEKDSITVHVFSDMAAPPEMPIVIDYMALKDILGPPLFDIEVSRRTERENNCCRNSSGTRMFFLPKSLSKKCHNTFYGQVTALCC